MNQVIFACLCIISRGMKYVSTHVVEVPQERLPEWRVWSGEERAEMERRVTQEVRKVADVERFNRGDVVRIGAENHRNRGLYFWTGKGVIYPYNTIISGKLPAVSGYVPDEFDVMTEDINVWPWEGSVWWPKGVAGPRVFYADLTPWIEEIAENAVKLPRTSEIEKEMRSCFLHQRMGRVEIYFDEDEYLGEMVGWRLRADAVAINAKAIETA